VFGSNNISVKHLESLEELETHRMIARRKGVDAKKLKISNVKWLLYLRRVEDIIKSVELTVNPVITGVVDSKREIVWIILILQSYLADLDLLNAQASRYNRTELSVLILKLSNVLRAFASIMEDDPEKASLYWRATVKKEVERVLAFIKSDSSESFGEDEG
jgi:hypothetical protein